jgi:hypothetical protein
LTLLLAKFPVFASLVDKFLRQVDIKIGTVALMLLEPIRPHAIPYLWGLSPEIIKRLSIANFKILVENGLATYAVDGEYCFNSEVLSPYRESLRECIADHPEMVGDKVIRISRNPKECHHICWYWQLFAPQEKAKLLSGVPDSMKSIVGAAVCEEPHNQRFYERHELEVLPTLPEDVAYKCIYLIKPQTPLLFSIWSEPSPMLDWFLRDSRWMNYAGGAKVMWIKSLFPSS